MVPKWKAGEKKIVVVMFSMAIFLSLLFCILLYLVNCMPRKVSVEGYTSGNDQVHYWVDEISYNSLQNTQPARIHPTWYISTDFVGYDERYVTILGGAYVPEESIRSANSLFVLHNTQEDTYLRVPTSVVQVEGLSEIYNYNLSGLFGVVRRNFLQQGQVYELYILYLNNGDEYLVSTNETILVG